MFSNVGKTEDIQYQTLKNSGTEPTDSRLDGRSREAPTSREAQCHTGLRCIFCSSSLFCRKALENASKIFSSIIQVV
ncbi:MAG: hypothetical protein ACRC2T_01290 [Thermoguttaceae bacterium]